MKVTAGLSVLVVLCLALATPVPAYAKPAGEGAFLIESASSVHELVAQVQDSRLVALRYAKHFRTDPSSVLTYFRNQLSTIKLTKTALFDIYYLDESNNIVSMAKELKAGTRVFANKSATPILEIGTGNPLVSTLPLPGSVQRLASSATEGGPANGEVVVQVLEQPPFEMPTGTPESGTATISTAPDSGIIVATRPDLSPEVAAGAGSTARSSSVPSWLLPVGLAGAAAAFGGGGGGAGDVSPPPSPPAPPTDVGGNTEPVIVIPEPAGLLAMGTGITALCGCIYRRRRRHCRRVAGKSE